MTNKRIAAIAIASLAGLTLFLAIDVSFDDFSANPNTIDITGVSDTVTCALTLTSVVGIKDAGCVYVSPSGRGEVGCTARSHVADVWSCVVTFKADDEEGKWLFAYAWARDNALDLNRYVTQDVINETSVVDATELDVIATSTNEDTLEPSITNFTALPPEIAPNGTITCDVTATDLSGIRDRGCTFQSPDQTQSASCTAYDTDTDCTATVGDVEGVWNAVNVFARDPVGNLARLDNPVLSFVVGAVGGAGGSGGSGGVAGGGGAGGTPAECTQTVDISGSDEQFTNSSAQTDANTTLTFTGYMRLSGTPDPDLRGSVNVSNAVITAHSQPAMILRFAPGGEFEMADGPDTSGFDYFCQVPCIPWELDTWYQFELLADITGNTYTARVGKCGEALELVGANRLFRGAPYTGPLTHYAVWSFLGTFDLATGSAWTPGACDPNTCLDYDDPEACGMWPDGCGGSDIDCGTCAAPGDVCFPVAAGQCCTPNTCANAGPGGAPALCGTPPDGCGDTLPSCGTCTGGDTCSPVTFTCVPTGPADLIDVSRIACETPCGIFVDVVDGSVDWDEVEHSRFVWDFDDPGDAYPTEEGFMAAHVYELAEEDPVTEFTITLDVTREDGSAEQDTVVVTVSPNSGETLCIANSDFSACPSAAGADHYTSISAAWADIAPGDRVLFKRGDVFSGTWDIASNGTGPVHVGTFDTGAKPQISLSSRLDVESLWSFTDLDIDATTTSDTAVGMGNGKHSVFRRNDVHGGGTSLTGLGAGYDGPNDPVYVFAFDNVFTQPPGTGRTNYCGGMYWAQVGNYFERWESTRHTMRVPGCRRCLYMRNTYYSDASHSSLTVRGSGGGRPGSQWVLIQENRFSKQMSIHPQNGSSNEHLQYIIAERNIYLPHPSSSSDQQAFLLGGEDMVMRNNVIYETRRAFALEDHPLAGPCERIHIYNNTQYSTNNASASEYFISQDASSDSGIESRNNIMFYDGNNVDVYNGPDPGVISDNYVYSPNSTGDCILPDDSATCTNPNMTSTDPGTSAYPGTPANASFMLPGAGTPGIDVAPNIGSGSFIIPWIDWHDLVRPVNTTNDVGGVERP